MGMGVAHEGECSKCVKRHYIHVNLIVFSVKCITNHSTFVSLPNVSLISTPL